MVSIPMVFQPNLPGEKLRIRSSMRRDFRDLQIRLSRIPMENVTEKLSQHLASLQYEDLPPEVVDYAKVLLLDSLGVALYGADKKWSKIIVDYIKRVGGKEEATIWGTQFKAPKANTALANGVMIHSFELDDYHNAAKLHPGAVVIPAALATGETADTHGRQLITSLVCGYETMIRTSLGAGPSSAKNRGWHLTGICGPFGAAAAAGKIIGFGAKKMANALGLAGTQASGLFAFTADGSMSKRFHPGKAAQNGINAVELVSQGFTGPTQILEAKDGGFCKAVSDDFSLERIIYGLGKNFEILKTSIKPYSCCGSVHSAIDGMLQLRERHHIKTESIEEVTIGTSSVVKLQCGWDYKPESVLQAQMSLQYCIAAALLEGQVFIDQFTEERIATEDVLKLARKVKVKVDEEIDRVYPNKFSNKVEALLKDGTTYSIYVEHPKGSPDNPLSPEEVEEKFKRLTEKIISDKARGKIFELINKLEKIESLRSLINLISS